MRCRRGRPLILQPFKTDSFTIDSNLPYVLGFIAYRMPGTDSPDYAAAQILGDVLANERADLYGMVPAGKALAAEFGFAEAYRKASVGYGVVALPADADAAGAMTEMRQIIDATRPTACPRILWMRPSAAKLRKPSSNATPFLGLADVWSAALAAEGRNSPEEDVDAIRKVTLADVNRVAKQYLLNTSTIYSHFEAGA